ncbi:MAG: hypothetical protein ACFCUR_08320 [Rhodomicrobiaceae bacterium]
MRRTLTAAALLAALTATATPVGAQDFSKDSQANSWNLVGEQKARFSAKVVDILCELSGDCPEDCGGGARQLGIVRSADNALIPVLKNGQPLFNGAIPDLLPYCNQAVDVDGLILSDETIKSGPLYQIQLIRREGETEWAKTNLWTKTWADDNPEFADKTGEWFRNDPAVQKQIAADGYFGLGKEADEKYIKDNF